MKIFRFAALLTLLMVFAAIRVPDFEAAVSWYVTKLDFRLLKSSPLNEKTYGF